MSAADDDVLRKKHLILLEKHRELRRNHRKLAGVALQLTEALAAYVKEEAKPNVQDILISCSKIYPELVWESRTVGKTEEDPRTDFEVPEIAETGVEEAEAGAENKEEAYSVEKNLNDSDKEYYQGFCSRPKIPRTPHISDI